MFFRDRTIFLPLGTMKKILTISGSARKGSTNAQLLDALPIIFSQYQFHRFEKLHLLPIFTEIVDENSYPEIVMEWRNAVKEADAVIVSTPEYIFNLPAIIKNALEWLTASGEMHQKKVLPITYLPQEPRGEKAMQSLLWSLQAMDTQIVTQLPLYQTEIEFDENGKLVENECVEILKEAIQLLTT